MRNEAITNNEKVAWTLEAQDKKGMHMVHKSLQE